MVWLGLVTRRRAPSPPSALPPRQVSSGGGGTHSRMPPPPSAGNGCTSIHFGENQLSPGSIGISPLATGHPPVLQHRWVRASTRSYPRFTLPMASSPGFGSHQHNAAWQHPRPVQTRFRCGSMALARVCGHLTCRAPLGGAGAVPMHSPDHSSKGTPSGLPQHPERCGARALRLLVGRGVQGLFHSPCGVLFTFPSRYSCTIGGQRVFSLGGWSPLLPTGLLVSRGTQGPGHPRPPPRVPTGLSPSLVGRPRPFGSARWVCSYAVACALRRARRPTRPYNPQTPPKRGPWVWAAPGSLATTTGISLDVSSSRY